MEERRKENLILHEEIKEVKEDVKQILKILNGNGKKGIIAIIDDHHSYIESCKGFARTCLLSFATGIILILLGFLAYKLGIPH